MHLSLLGSPTPGRDRVSDSLREAGFDLRPVGYVQVNDVVVFCISCSDDVAKGTLQSICNCAGLSICPVAIILSDAELVDDESLRALLTLEVRSLLSRIMPESEVRKLLVLFDFDPYLVKKIQSSIANGLKEVSCFDDPLAVHDRSTPPKSNSASSNELRESTIATAILVLLASVVTLALGFAVGKWFAQVADWAKKIGILDESLDVLLVEIIVFGVMIVQGLFLFWTGTEAMALIGLRIRQDSDD